MEALPRYAAQRPDGSSAGGSWFSLGDRDLATHLYRSGRLSEGASLSEITAEIGRAWDVDVRIVPMSDDPVRTKVETDTGWIDFQEYFVGRQHAVPVSSVRFEGADTALAHPEALAAIVSAETVVIAPSNPIVSIGPIRALAGIDAALALRRETVVAISPIVAGAALKGPADRMLTELGHDASVVGVARLYAPICATLVIDDQDADLAGAVEAEGVRCVVTDTIMRSVDVAAALARTALAAAHP
jgi:LPPG:FO 2-phospho-L-lactate transferase